MSATSGSLPNASGHSDAQNNPTAATKKRLGDLAPPPASAPEETAVRAIEGALGDLTPDQVDRIAEKGARAEATEIVAARHDMVADRIARLGAAAVRKAARKTIDDFYKAHCARRVSGR